MARAWRLSTQARRQGRQPAKDGRIRIGLDGTLHYRYRLAWLYMTGSWPAANVDHINGDHTDDRWANLRDVPQVLNVQNRRGAQTNNTTGLLGVSPTPSGRFTTAIWVHKQKHYLGTFDTPEEAHAVYMTARRKHHLGNTL